MRRFVQSRLERVTDFSNTIELSQHPDLTLDVLKKNSDLAWNFNAMTFLPQFNISWVKEFPFQFWDWNRLSNMFSIDVISKNKELFWNWRSITQKMSVHDMLKYPDLPWDFGAMFIKPITREHLTFFRYFKNKIPQWKWHYHAKNLTWDAFKHSLDLPWIWDIEYINIDSKDFKESDVYILRMFQDVMNWINLTINVPIHIINDNLDLPWRLEFLQWNKTSWRTPVQSIEKCIREWYAASTIKRFWKRAICNPEYKLCKKRIYKEFKELERESKRMATVSFTRLRSDAVIPSKATPGSIGLDLHSVDSYVVLPGQRIVVATGLRVNLPPGCYGRIAPRSGLAVKHGLDVGAGVVDPDYTGELRVVLFNHDSMHPFVIRPGWRIAQLIIERAVDDLVVEEVPYEDVDTERGDGGFGSTGR